jgi:hypothetical protein
MSFFLWFRPVLNRARSHLPKAAIRTRLRTLRLLVNCLISRRVGLVYLFVSF